MGNTHSTSKPSMESSTNPLNDTVDTNTNTNKHLGQLIDYIATHYILTMNFDSLKKLSDKAYCDKLVVLTADIIEKYFTPLEITYLNQRMKNGVEVNEVAHDKTIFFLKDQLSTMDIQNPLKKKRVCIGIAKFYIKVAHIFAAIVTTINPTYVYKDTIGNVTKVSLHDKDKIPSNVARQVYKLNICQNRINALKRGQDYSTDNDHDDITVHPNVCSFNLNKVGNVKTLAEEPGIPELMELYYDDNYDYNSGRFLGMSPETKKDYEEDLRIFYNVFTGNNVDVLPENVNSFNDIKLKDYKQDKICQGSTSMGIKGSLTNKLFAEYANNMKQMVKNANENQEQLLNVINKLFVYSINPTTKEKEIRVNPILNEENIHTVVLETRAIIMKLYLTCEIDYVNGIKIYEAIVEDKILETSQKQIDHLGKMSESLAFSENI